MGKTIVSVVIMGIVLSGVFIVLYFAEGQDSLGPSATPARAADNSEEKSGEIKFAGDPVKNLDEINRRFLNFNSELSRLKDENNTLKKKVAKLEDELGKRAAANPGAEPPSLDGEGKYAAIPGGNSLLGAFPSAKEDIKEILKAIKYDEMADRRAKNDERMREQMARMLDKVADKYGWDTGMKSQVEGLVIDRQDRIRELFSSLDPQTASQEERKNIKKQVNEIVKDSNDQLAALVGNDTFKELQKFLSPNLKNKNQKAGRAGGMRPERRNKASGRNKSGWNRPRKQ